MSVFKDNDRGTFYVKCNYVDYTETKKQKLQRGFKLQRETKEWERNFLKAKQADMTVYFHLLSTSLKKK